MQYSSQPCSSQSNKTHTVICEPSRRFSIKVCKTIQASIFCNLTGLGELPSTRQKALNPLPGLAND